MVDNKKNISVNILYYALRDIQDLKIALKTVKILLYTFYLMLEIK